MKKNYFLILVLLSIGFSSMAQFSGLDYGKHYANLLNRENEKEDVDGSPYLFDEWADGVVLFRDEKGGKYDQIKIDLMNNQLEIMYMDSEKILPYNEFSKLKLNHPGTHPNTFFQVATKFRYKDDRLAGFAKITPIGEDYEVIEVYKIKIIPPSMNGKIVGAKYKKTIKKETKLYVSKKGKVYRVKKKKEIYKFLSKKQKKLKAYINDNDLSHKKEADLIKIIEFYNDNILNIKK